jgi:hypothetical protein
MSKDEQNNDKIVEEESDVVQDEDLSKKNNSDEDEDTSEDEDTDEEIDYKSEYEHLQGELAQKNERIEKQDKKIIKLKHKDEDNEEEDTENIDEIVNKKVQQQMNSFVSDVIEEELEKVSTNDDEKKLIKWYFENRIQKTGYARKDITQYFNEAKALANARKFLSTSKMLAKKVKSEDTKGSPAFAGTPPKPPIKITEYDKNMAQKFFKGDIKKWLKYKS